MDNEFRIIDDARERRYFTILPNLVIDSGLSPHAIALYARIKRRAGEQGLCWESTRNLAAGCSMSVGMVSRAKKELVAAGLITIEKRRGPHGDYDEITVVDIWEKNMRSYCERTSSPDERLRSQYERKKNPIKNGAEEKHRRRHSDALSPRAVEKSKTDFSPRESESLSVNGKPPIIEAIKTITGYYPRKNLWKRISETFGADFDIERMRDAFDHWTASGYNPQNISGWLFDYYATGLHYLTPSQRLPEVKEIAE